MKYFYLSIVSLMSLSAFSQGLPDRIVFDYDSSGNQIYRGIEIDMTNYGLRASQNPKLENGESEQNNIPSFGYENAKLRYYPNPVQDILNIEWDEQYKRVDFMILYTANLRTVREVSNLEQADHASIDFGNLPVGSYYLTIFYLDKTEETITLIKR